MQDDGDKPGRQPSPLKHSAKDSQQGRRQDRLKLALRENLKRRKSQARGRSDAAPGTIAASSNDAAASPYGDSAKKPGG